MGFKIPLSSGLFSFSVKRDVLTGVRVKSGRNCFRELMV